MMLDEMCVAAARYADRYDEYERTLEGGTSNEAEDWYEDDALHYFNVFRDGINEAYREVSRLQAMPDRYETVTVDENKQIDLSAVTPGVYGIKLLLNENRTATVDYTFSTKYILDVNVEPGTVLQIFYHYIPDDLIYLDDTPVFTEAQVDPMLYISLAVARMWYSEKKFDFGNQWMSQYYNYLRNVRSSLKDRSRRRIPRGLFR
jgi:hypothetical protein